MAVTGEQLALTGEKQQGPSSSSLSSYSIHLLLNTLKPLSYNTKRYFITIQREDASTGDHNAKANRMARYANWQAAKQHHIHL